MLRKTFKKTQVIPHTININHILRKYLNPRLITAKMLDVNTLLSENTNATKNPNNAQNLKNSNTQEMNLIVNNNISPKYRITKYLGEGVNGHLYLAKDKYNKLYICKKITIEPSLEQSLEQSLEPNAEPNVAHNLHQNTNTTQQIEFELNILKYLSQNQATNEYINPCLEHKIIANQIYTIFPVFNGYSLSNIQNYLIQLSKPDYYKLVFYMIKNILQGMANIHNTNIAHQNINNNSILVSSELRNATEYDLPIKFTDFGLGCGHNIRNAKHDIFLNKCNNSQLPIKITPQLMASLNESGYLKLAKKWDIFCLGALLVKLLVPDVTIPVSSGYTSSVATLIAGISEKYLNVDKTRENGRKVYITLPGINKDDLRQDIGTYLDIIMKNMITKSENRETCQYVLDKLIIYEKYKNEIL